MIHVQTREQMKLKEYSWRNPCLRSKINFQKYVKYKGTLGYLSHNVTESIFRLVCPAKHYENTHIQIYRKFHLQNRKFSCKTSDIFHISAQNIDCGYSLEPPRRGGSNEYPQSMFLSRNKKNNVYPCKPQFYYIKVGFKGVKII